jgi:hypothetical protein
LESIRPVKKTTTKAAASPRPATLKDVFHGITSRRRRTIVKQWPDQSGLTLARADNAVYIKGVSA